jgi:hypothetical protein
MNTDWRTPEGPRPPRDSIAPHCDRPLKLTLANGTVRKVGRICVLVPGLGFQICPRIEPRRMYLPSVMRPRAEEASFLGLTEAQHLLEVTRIAYTKTTCRSRP